jgi:tetratricopeptide (TPR) repeat protein
MELKSKPKISDASAVQTRPRAGRRGVNGGGRRRLWHVSLALVVLVAGYLGLRMIRGGPASADAIWEQAQQDFSAGRYELVESALGRLGQLRAPTPLDWFLRAQLALYRNNIDQALLDLARVPDDHYMAAQARLLAGQTELRRNRVRLAEELLRHALNLDPRLVQAHRELIYIYGMQLRRREVGAEFTALANLKELTFENVFHWCLLRNNSWEPGEAVQSLSSYVAADPADRSSRLALAENYLRMDRLDDAESTIAGLARDDSEAVELRARIALERQDLDQADHQLDLGRVGDPLVARLRARLALSRGDVKSAVANYRASYAADPDNRESTFGLVAALERSGEKQAANALRETAGKLDRLNSLIQRAALPAARGDAGLMRQLGAACAALDRKGEARAWYKLAIDLDPLDSESQQALFRLNDPGQINPRPSSPTPTP